MTINTVKGVRFVRQGQPYHAYESGFFRAAAEEDGYEVRLADSVCFIEAVTIRSAFMAVVREEARNRRRKPR